MVKEYRGFLNSLYKDNNGTWQVKDIHYMGKITVNELITVISYVLKNEIKNEIKRLLGLDADALIKLFYYYEDRLILINYIKEGESIPIGHLSLID